MGMVIEFTKVTPQQLAAAADGEGWREEDDDAVDGYLDKAWADIEHLMGKAGKPIDFHFEGEMLDEDGTQFGWDVELVAKTAKTLAETPFAQLESHYDPEAIRDDEDEDLDDDEIEDEDLDEDDLDDDSEVSDLEYVREYYEVLVAFFADAARSKSAAIMDVDF